VPQQDPGYYGSCMEAFTTPELITGPIPVTGEKLASVVRGFEEVSVSMPTTMATPKAAVTPQQEAEPWHE